jgi:hypothetical protein
MIRVWLYKPRSSRRKPASLISSTPFVSEHHWRRNKLRPGALQQSETHRCETGMEQADLKGVGGAFQLCFLILKFGFLCPISLIAFTVDLIM